jgi:hypothetical protein
MGQNRRPRNKPTTTAIWFLTKEPETYTGEKTASSIYSTGKTGYLPAED